ncbi:MAG: cell division protein ZapA [Gammaproteobacteria bacterium]|jgi:cell division protein ZapA
MAEAPTMSVSILDREYQVSCPAGEEEALRASARFLDRRMRDIRENGKVFGMDRIAVMAALNITHELLSGQVRNESIDSRIKRLGERIDEVIAEQKELRF